jgi:hypothetical protein
VRHDLNDLQRWVNRVLAFWAGTDAFDPLGSLGVALAETILCRSIEVRPLLAAENHKVLLLCYNRLLAEMLKRPLASTPNIQVMSFHQLCDSRIAQVKRDLGRNLLNEADTAFPGADLFDVHMPFALALSNEVLPHKFDAIVIDEAQDFSDEYWFAIEELLYDPKDGAIYIFIDPNQALYKRHANLPVREDPYYLTVNCRNTTYIHKAAYR